MPKKHIPNPSDFSKPKAGVYQKAKEEGVKKETSKKKFQTPNLENRKNDSEPVKKHRKSKRAFLAEEQKLNVGYQKLEPKFQNKYLSSKAESQQSTQHSQQSTDEMPLNKFVAHCGICSRREAVEIIKKGKIKLNGLVETEPGKKVSEKDIVIYEEKRLYPQKNLVYYLLNKPKGFITTTNDPEGRRTVMDLVKAIPEPNVFPVGRLDRNTTGLLLLTNDGVVAQKLTHPKYKIKKVYQVTLDNPLTKRDFEKIIQGIMLEDGIAIVDDLAFTDEKNKREIGIEIHIGRNRIVRRIFEHLGYKVEKLDRVLYVGLTKKNLERGHFRKLTDKEIIYLKHFK